MKNIFHLISGEDDSHLQVVTIKVFVYLEEGVGCFAYFS